MASTWGKAEDIFGHDAKVHPVTGRHIEQGIGALPEDHQVAQQLRDIEREQGVGVASNMRAKLIDEKDGVSK